MNTQKEVASFIEFLSTSENLEPLNQIACRATLTQGAIPFSYTVPIGWIVLYPKFLVFLTNSKYEKGNKLLFMHFIERVSSEIMTAKRLNDWVTNPETIIISAAKWLLTDQNKQDFLQEALMNPSSFFIPTDAIEDMKFNKGIIALRPHSIQITLKEGGLRIFQDPVLENQVKTLIGQFTGKWQEKFIENINFIIRNNNK